MRVAATAAAAAEAAAAQAEAAESSNIVENETKRPTPLGVDGSSRCALGRCSGQGLGVMAQATEVDEGISAIPFHGHDTEVAAEVARVAPADGQPVPAGEVYCKDACGKGHRG